MLKPPKRLPHSVIGSSSIGASIIGGICNNSGGALIERGPSYTELALYARINEAGELNLINNLGIHLGDTPEEILTRLQEGDFSEEDVEQTDRKASDANYLERIRDVEASTPARYNADPGCLYEVSGSGGKLFAVFAVRVDTFPMNEEAVFYIGTNDKHVLRELRREILTNFEHLPVSAEYMHRDIFDIAKKYGKDTSDGHSLYGHAIFANFFALKGKFDAWARNQVSCRIFLVINYCNSSIWQMNLMPQSLINTAIL